MSKVFNLASDLSSHSIKNWTMQLFVTDFSEFFLPVFGKNLKFAILQWQNSTSNSPSLLYHFSDSRNHVYYYIPPWLEKILKFSVLKWLKQFPPPFRSIRNIPPPPPIPFPPGGTLIKTAPLGQYVLSN